MSVETKKKFYEELEVAVTAMIDSNLDFTACILLAHSKDQTFNLIHGPSIDIIKAFAIWTAKGNLSHAILAKTGIKLGLEIRECSEKKDDLFKNLLEKFKNEIDND